MLHLLQNTILKYIHLFFDLDRTLWDYDTNAKKALSIIYEQYKLGEYCSSPEDFFTIYTKHNDQLWQDYRNGYILKDELRKKRFNLTLAEVGYPDDTRVSEIDTRYMYLTPRQDATFPNCISTLEYLKNKNYHLYILTNGFIKTQEKKIKFSKLEKYFERIFSSEQISVNKPKKEFFHWVVSSLHAAKSDCLMIGDDYEVDILGARSYGIETVWFNPEEKTFDQKQKYMIKDLSELKNIL